ncbi:MAG: integrase arm-type DNA-binding domain-containing protein [Rhodoferax sp.]|uniref:tyrosine-type recombinase/integrase n=1 Tax=Rhodoferax sp. TaxID=50421 RepID=UPI001B646E2F|nr:integrase arm-type DNA-binding domain-containing protein [Rhodoferax sp.]MBP9904876.1 integrase arm-type DNA-binding domain-containing protein [Rhodoferax sp.]
MLTDAQCRNAKCPPERKQARFADSGGMYLQVSPAGSKRWFLKYRVDGKEKQLALGSYPDVTLTAARKARDAAKIQKADGIDPLQARQVERLKESVGSGDTLTATASDWLERGKPNWSETHYVRERRNITKDLMPYLGKRVIASIKPIELLAVIQKVEARGSLDVAHRVLITAHGVWCHAVATGRAERDISQDIKKALRPHIKENLPAIIDPVKLGELLRASDAYQGGPTVRAALKLAPILFQRPGNLRTMRWADVDMDRALWSIPSEAMKRTKAEKINGQPHVVPLPRQAVEVLRDLHKLTGEREFVFPGLRDWRAPMSEAGVSAALAAMGYKGIHTWHGYRATGRTILRQVLKYPKDVIEAQLAHTGQITHGGAYDRTTHLEDRTAMLQVWADYLDKLAKGGDVIKFKAA